MEEVEEAIGLLIKNQTLTRDINQRLLNITKVLENRIKVLEMDVKQLRDPKMLIHPN
jgi:hypothetical protein